MKIVLLVIFLFNSPIAMISQTDFLKVENPSEFEIHIYAQSCPPTCTLNAEEVPEDFRAFLSHKMYEDDRRVGESRGRLYEQ